VNENLFFNGILEKWQDNLKVMDELGGPRHFNHFPAAWAHAMDTPFQWTKQVASHFGGTRNPMIVSWPARIKDKGGLRSQFLHVIDIVPTLYEVIGITPPQSLNGVTQKPIEGISFAYTFDDARARGRRTTQYFEMGANRGLYHDGWMASASRFHRGKRARGRSRQQKWELYDVDKDFSQATTRRATSQKLRELQDLGGRRRRSTTSCRWTGVWPSASTRARGGRASRHAKTLTYYAGRSDCRPRARRAC
jgi:arylsulfatase